MRKILYVFAWVILLSPAEAAYLDLGWDPNQEPDLAGYKVYYGTSSGDYINFVDVGLTTTYRLDSLLEDVTFYIAITAYDLAGNESDFSDEVFGIGIIDNSVPVANDDAYNAEEDKSLTVASPGVLGNDDDPEGDLLNAVLVDDPSTGTLTFSIDGSFTYTPNSGFSGTDAFTYKANDGKLDSNIATVTITVKPSASQTAHVSIAMSRSSFWIWWRATATVTIKNDQGLVIEGATIEGHWSGAYNDNVSNKTDTNGEASFRTGWIGSWITNGDNVCFTIDRVSKDVEYSLNGEKTKCISR